MTVEKLRETVESLSDDQALKAADQFGRAIAIRMGVPSGVADKRVREDAALPAFPAPRTPIEGSERARLATACRFALLQALDSDDPVIVETASTVIEDARDPEVALALGGLAVAGAVLVALAIVGKVSYSKEEGWKVEKGLPGIEKAGKAVGELLRAAFGGGSS